jgi:D-alanyl-D-alanine endopeptidase (penicillin-binding protein 7)
VCGLASGLLVFLPVSAGAQSVSTAQISDSPSTRISLARAAAAARAKTLALRSRQQREAATAQYALDELGNVVPDVRAAAAIVYNPQTGDVLWESHSRDQRSIASLTKIMTAVTFMADDPDLSRLVTVTRADVSRASVTYLRSGDVISLGNLLHLMLIASDNAAARVLARTSDGGSAAFIDRMNKMAEHLGLASSRYADPSGLDARNVSSAYDVSQLMAFAGSDETLGPIMRMAQYEVRTTKRRFAVRSTNKLLGTEVDVLGAKTGFIRKAGYCLATLLQAPQGTQLAVVVLGATNSTIRFWEARHLFRWAAEQTQELIAGLPHIDSPQ